MEKKARFTMMQMLNILASTKTEQEEALESVNLIFLDVNETSKLMDFVPSIIIWAFCY